MNIESTNKIRNAAFECARNRICQTEGGTPHCKISCTVGGRILFTASRFPGNCPMQHTYGSTFICTCPVRREIFKKENR